jgi:TonB family protein
VHAYCQVASIFSRHSLTVCVAVAGRVPIDSNATRTNRTRPCDTVDAPPPSQSRGVPQRRKQSDHAPGQTRLATTSRAPDLHSTHLDPHPQLALPITVAFDIPIDNTSVNIGDPFSRLPNGGLGANGVNGLGNHGCCQGIGESQSGTPGIGLVHRGRGVTPPQLLYKVEPEFSEEARKAKHQGVVLLSIVVDASGNVRNIRVLQQLGLGLDEKAIEAVSRWRFQPGLFDGKPVATEATVQVNFQLM